MTFDLNIFFCVPLRILLDWQGARLTKILKWLPETRLQIKLKNTGDEIRFELFISLYYKSTRFEFVFQWNSKFQNPGVLTTAHGAPIGDKTNSMSVGPRGIQ